MISRLPLYLILCSTLLKSSIVLAQVVLFQCNFDGPEATAGLRWIACGGTIPDSSGFDTDATLVPGPIGQGAKIQSPGTWGHIDADIPDRSEVTIVYYEKFDVWPLTNGNAKSVRPFYGPGFNDYLAAIISSHFGNEGKGDPNPNPWYHSGFYEATLIPTSKVVGVDTRPDYCQPIGGGSYFCPHIGTTGGRARVDWRPSFGTSWHKIRIHIKMPTSDQSNDGLIHVWIDEELLYTLKDLRKMEGGTLTTTLVKWFPSDDAAVPYGHYLDEVKVYEGYVSPSGDSTPPAAPKNLAAR